MCLLVGAAGVAGANTETVLHSFVPPPKGATPLSGLIRGPGGELYGTAEYGGSNNAGVVYRLDAGRETVLYSFTGGADGGLPQAGVIRDFAGNLYGTTSRGGAANAGVVYMLEATGIETVLHSFTGGADGANPYAGVIRDDTGNLYGTTVSGGTARAGVVYKVDPTGHESILYSFTGADGSQPYGGVIRGPGGVLYGTTSYGGSIGAGTVYKLDAKGHETVLHNFGIADGAVPFSGVVRDATGNLYGTTFNGGSGCPGAGCGVVYKLDPSGNETVLYSFSGSGGSSPFASVTLDAASNLYGTTQGGGAAGSGVVFQLDPGGNETLLHSFTGGADGQYPSGGVIRDSAGNLYGASGYGGSTGLGIVYKLDAVGVETVLHRFMSAEDGSGPQGGVIGDGTGNLYGTTEYGGPANLGVVYKLSAGVETVLHSFAGGVDGKYPYAGVIRDSGGNLYGTTEDGGLGNGGVVYRIDPAGNETILHNFGDGFDGGIPYGGLIRDADGNLYGTTAEGGTAGAGSVFKLDASGHETILYSFQGGTDGYGPMAGVIRDQAGNLYGTTANGGDPSGNGVVFEVDSAGNETILHRFAGGADGAVPVAGVIRDAQGNLYGTTAGGGVARAGTVYMVSSSGQETVLYSFTGKGDGGSPYGEVARDAAGNLYGTASTGGASNAGVVFMVSPGGQETVLHSFTGGVDGGLPLAGVIRDKAGNIFGTAMFGGTRGGGVVFRVAGQ